MANPTPICSDCGATLSGLSPLGLCPACLVDSSAFPDDETSITGDDLENLGTVIDRYKLLEVIGEGGFGVVYMAEQREPVRRMVALKIIKLGMDTKQVIARFESERQALALMEHPNIARVIDAGATATGRPYFVMELVRGIPIDRFCDEQKLGTRERLQLFLGVCSAIQHAHQKGIIHRDLKPSNVLVSIDDDGPIPKVIDFGIAKATAAQRLTDLTVFTQFHQFLGTPAYTSPEQAQFDARDVDTRSDIYSLGVLLYTLLTGQTPFDQDALMTRGQDAVFKAIREEEPPRPSTRINALTNAQRTSTAALRKESPNQLSSQLRGDLDKVVMKAMEKDRRRRYETANSFALDLQRYLDDEPVTAVAPNAAYRMRKWVRRNRGLALATVAVLAALLVGLIATVFQARRAEAGELAAQENALAARKSFYLADMNVVQQALESGGVDRARMILQRHIPKKGEEDLRNWEWRYFWGQANRHQFHLIADDDPNDDIPPDAIFELALSPRGDLMASAARSGIIRLWDLASRQEIAQFKIDAQQHAWVDFSPDGRYLAAGGLPNMSSDLFPQTVIYDVDKNSESHRFCTPMEAGQPRFVSDRMVCVGDIRNTLLFWDIEEKAGTLVEDPEHTGGLFIATMAAAPQAKRFLTSSYYSNRVFLWDATSRQLTRSIEGRGIGHRMAITPDGRLGALFPKQMPWVDIIDGNSGEKLAELQLESPINDGRFNHDGTMLVTADYTGNVRLFDTRTWNEVGRYHHPGHQLNAVAASSDGSLIVSGGESGIILGWPGTPQEAEVIETTGRIVTAVRYSPDGRLLAIGTGEGGLEVWDSQRVTRVHALPEQTDERPQTRPIEVALFHDDFFAFRPDGRQLAVAHRDGEAHSVRVLDTATFGILASLPHQNEVLSVEYSPDGKLLGTGPRKGGSAQVWDADSFQLIREFPGAPWGLAQSFSPDSRLLLSHTGVWDMATGNQLTKLIGAVFNPTYGTHSITFSRDGSMLATASGDRQVTLSDAQSMKPIQSLLGHSFAVMDLSFSPEGKRLASSGRDSQCRLWDVASGQEIASFKGYAVDFSPDGNTLAIGGATDFTEKNAIDGGSSVRLYSAKTFEEIAARGEMVQPQKRNVREQAPDKVFERHKGIWLMRPNGEMVRRLAPSEAVDRSEPQITRRGGDRNPKFSPDGRTVLFDSDRDGAENLYMVDIETGELVQLTDSHSRERKAAWSPDGQWVVYQIHLGSNVDIWKMRLDGSGKQRLTSHEAMDTSADWSPDGNTIAFVSRRTGSRQIYLMDMDGSNQRAVTSSIGWSYHPAWSPTGEQIAFSSSRSGSEDIYVMQTDGSGLTRLTETHGFQEITPSWFPNGEGLLLSQYPSTLKLHAARLDLQTRDIKRITSTPDKCHRPRMSPDGRWIVAEFH